MTLAFTPAGDHLNSRFDYSQLDESTARLAWQRAQEIRWLSDSVAQQVVDIGKKLIDVQSRLPRGLWIAWVRDELNMSVSHAGDLMRIAHTFGDIDLHQAKASMVTLRLLSASSLPPEVIQAAKNRLATGEELSVKDARRLVAASDPQLADMYHSNYWATRRGREAKQIISHAAEFQAAVRNLQVRLADAYGVPLSPSVSGALQQLQELISVIMGYEEGPKVKKFNKRKQLNSSSKYFGVTWQRKAHKWAAMISHENKTLYIGLFESEEEAARSVDAKARELYGDKARLNFPDERP